MKRRLISLFLAALMILSLAACTGNQETTGETIEGAHVKVVTLSHPSWPMDGTRKVWEYIREGTGADVEVQAIPSTDFYTKVSLMYADPESLPDVMAFDSKTITDRYSGQGALIALDDVAEYMPEYNAFIEKLPEEEARSIVDTRKAIDGKVYYAPVYGRDRMQGVRAWLYREDIFKKHNLAIPNNQEELFEVSRELKKLYPDSYPFSLRNGLNFISMIGPLWKPYFTYEPYYDYNSEKWSYGATEPTMLEIIKFYRQMLDEKLIPSDFLTINAKTWEELVITGRGFIFPDYQVRIDFFTPLAKSQTPEFSLKAMVPPIMNEETGSHNLGKFNLDPYGLVLCNTKDEARIRNAARYLDWMYSDEAQELLSWGKEGETFEVVDGKRVYITDENGSQPNTLYGFALAGTSTRFDPEAVDAFESELIAEARKVTLEYVEDNVNPTMWLAFSDEESEIISQEGTAMRTYAKEMISKFVLGQSPISEFDNFVSTLNDMGAEKLLSVYTAAYDRVK